MVQRFAKELGKLQVEAKIIQDGYIVHFIFNFEEIYKNFGHVPSLFL